MRPTYKLRFVQQSDAGLSRDHNEDAYGYRTADPASVTGEGPLFVVADGMGGHAAGEVASRLAVDTLLHEYFHPSSGSLETHPPSAAPIDQAERLQLAIERANTEVYSLSQREPSMNGMGTTIVAVAFAGDAVIFANVGDSRGYLLRKGRLEQVTRDHSWIARAIEEGMLNPENAADHPNRHVIYRCLGIDSGVEVEICSRNPSPGDRILLCTDGLTDVISDEELEKWLQGESLADIATELIDTANQRGGPDNITLTIIDVQLAGEINSAEDPPTPVRLNSVNSHGERPRGVTAEDGTEDDPAERPTRPRLQLQNRMEKGSDNDRIAGPEKSRRRGWLSRLFSRD